MSLAIIEGSHLMILSQVDIPLNYVFVSIYVPEDFDYGEFQVSGCVLSTRLCLNQQFAGRFAGAVVFLAVSSRCWWRCGGQPPSAHANDEQHDDDGSTGKPGRNGVYVNSLRSRQTSY
jgi:hypothetical protein